MWSVNLARYHQKRLRTQPFEELGRELYLGTPPFAHITKPERFLIFKKLNILSNLCMGPLGLNSDVCNQIVKDIKKTVADGSAETHYWRLEYLELVLGNIVTGVESLEFE